MSEGQSHVEEQIKSRIDEMDAAAHKLGVAFVSAWAMGLNPEATVSNYELDLKNAGVWKFHAERISGGE